MTSTSPLHWRAIRAKYAGFTNLEENADYDRGRSDAARRTKAPWNEVLEAGERRIRSEIESDGDAFRMSFYDELDTSRRSFGHLERRIVDLGARRARMTTSFTARIEEVENALGRNSSAYQTAQGKWERAQEVFDELQAELKRPSREGAAGLRSVAVLAILFCFETPLNATALQLMSNLYNWYDWVAAIVIGTILLVFAHVQGVNARHLTGERSVGRMVGRAMAAVFFLAVLIAIVLLLALMRDQAFAILSNTTPTITLGIKNVAAEAAKSIAHSSLGTLTFEAKSFLIVNAIIVIVASLVAFLQTDPDDRYGRADKALRRAEKHFLSLRHRFEQRLAEVVNAHNEEMATIDRLDAQVRRESAELQEKLASVTEVAKAGARHLTTVKERRIAAYRQGFLHGSGPPPAPPELAGTLVDATSPEDAAEVRSPTGTTETP